MKNLPFELIEKAKQANNAEELLTIAGENHVDLTEKDAAAYFTQLNPKSGELSDNELDNVAGGGCSGESKDAHVRLAGGTCPYCGAANPSGYYGRRGGNLGFTYFIKNLDCCGNTMTLSPGDPEKLTDF